MEWKWYEGEKLEPFKFYTVDHFHNAFQDICFSDKNGNLKFNRKYPYIDIYGYLQINIIRWSKNIYKNRFVKRFIETETILTKKEHENFKRVFDEIFIPFVKENADDLDKILNSDKKLKERVEKKVDKIIEKRKKNKNEKKWINH